MSKRRKLQKGASARSAWIAPWQIAVLAGVALLVVGVLWLKGRPAASESVGVDLPAPALPTATKTAVVPLPTAEVSAPVASETGDLAPADGESPEAHMERMLAAGTPVFAFFHSNTCYQCTEMAKIVEQVYPGFSDSVALVDVNVYDDANQSLLQQAEIRVIPTLIFIDRAGEGQVSTGVMPAEELQATLTALADGETP